MKEIDIPPLLQSLWDDNPPEPDGKQKEAILYTKGPLFLPAGPGSGKTRVLLWRAVNLIVIQNVPPEEIFLSTFTEKAALQLKEGLRTLLGVASNKTGKPYDIAKLYVGTVHSLCRRMIIDRRFTNRQRTKPPILMDELSQYMFVRRKRIWDYIRGNLSNVDINFLFEGKSKISRHDAITHLISFFNRLSEEMIDPDAALKKIKKVELRRLLPLYSRYLVTLKGNGVTPERTDLSLLQSVAVNLLQKNDAAKSIFNQVIIDEYQDTNPVQERLFFLLAQGYKNICVVGDDDQALYRFRGATVENFVEFPNRCESFLHLKPREIILGKNYRSREDIVKLCNRFITHPSCDWNNYDSKSFYRVMNKIIESHRKGKEIAVIANRPGSPEAAASEIAGLVCNLIKSGKVANENKIAFLFPSLQSDQVRKMRFALEAKGLKVFAPRAGSFLEVPESVAVFGLIFKVFNFPHHYHKDFSHWLDTIETKAEELIQDDPKLKHFIEIRRKDLERSVSDYHSLYSTLKAKGWRENQNYDPALMQKGLASSAGLSLKARKSITSGLYKRFAEERLKNKHPFSVKYTITRASTLDWNLLDFFYQLCWFKYFKKKFNLAEKGKDEGPICNLSLISQYISRFTDEYSFPISGEWISSGTFQNVLTNFLYILFRRRESEYEDANDPFPKGRIPFITIHQAKGLEFPVVILANPRKKLSLQPMEELVNPLIKRKGEPLDRMPAFDVQRMFYVSLSRAKNLLVVAHFQGQGQYHNDSFDFLDGTITRIPDLKITSLPDPDIEKDDSVPQSYSYTGDFQLYRNCPRNYMIFRKYGFVPSRSQTMFFGSLVHQTLEDLHQQLIGMRA